MHRRFPSKCVHHVRKGDRIPTRGGGQRLADLVGLVLLTPAVTRARQRRGHFDRRLDGLPGAGQNQPYQSSADLGHQADRHDGDGTGRPLEAVLLDHVSDFVTEHTGEFVFGVEQGQQATRNVDVATGNGEGIGLGLVEHGKVELGDRFRIGFFDEPVPDRADIRGE